MDYNSLLYKKKQTKKKTNHKTKKNPTPNLSQKSNYFICLFYWIVGNLISTAQLGVFGCSSN